MSTRPNLPVSNVFNPSLFSYESEYLTLQDADLRYVKIGGDVNANSISCNSLYLGGSLVDVSAISGVTAGTASASKALIVDANRDITNIRYLTATQLTGTLQTASQPNITSVGTLSSLTVSGALNATLSTASQPNITALGTLTGLNVAGVQTTTNSYSIWTGNASAPTNTNGVGVRFSGLVDGGTGYLRAYNYVLAQDNHLSINNGNIYVKNTRNVGIDTTSPAYKLDVNGDINIASNMTFKINGSTVLDNNGKLTVANQSAITTVGTLGSLTVSGQINTGTLYASSGTAYIVNTASTTSTSFCSSYAYQHRTTGGANGISFELGSTANSNTTPSGTITCRTDTAGGYAGKLVFACKPTNVQADPCVDSMVLDGNGILRVKNGVGDWTTGNVFIDTNKRIFGLCQAFINASADTLGAPLQSISALSVGDNDIFVGGYSAYTSNAYFRHMFHVDSMSASTNYYSIGMNDDKTINIATNGYVGFCGLTQPKCELHMSQTALDRRLGIYWSGVSTDDFYGVGANDSLLKLQGTGVALYAGSKGNSVGSEMLKCTASEVKIGGTGNWMVANSTSISMFGTTANGALNVNNYKTYTYAGGYARYNLLTGSYQTQSGTVNINLSLYCSSNIWTDGGGVYTSSDRRLKSHVMDYDILERDYMALKPKRYLMNDEWQIGLIAQDVVRSMSYNYPDIINVCPKQGVKKQSQYDPDDNFVWTLQYDRLPIVNMNMVQKLVKRVNDMQKAMDEQADMLHELMERLNLFKHD